MAMMKSSFPPRQTHTMPLWLDSADIFLLLLFICLSASASCPPKYSLLHGVCLYMPDVKVSWCDAQAFCSRDANGELVRGDNFMKINGKALGSTYRYLYIGLTDALHERRRNRGGWRWTDGSTEPNSDTLAWGWEEPGNSRYQDYVILIANTGQSGDVVIYSPDPFYQGSPMCQPREGEDPTAAKQRSRSFEEVAVAVFADKEDYAGQGGCYRDEEVVSRGDCAAACTSDEYDWCVAFYYRAATRECRLVLYTDQSLDMGDGSGWSKFVRK